MTCCRISHPALGLMFALASCAGPNTPPLAPKQDIPDANQPFKKPVRMNGRGKMSSVSLSEFFALQQSGKAMIFDARPAFFYHLGHVPGAINLTKSNCDEDLSKREPAIKAALAEGKSIIVYCSSFTCPDARAVAIHISGFGYPANIFSGGWDEWKTADMPSE
jgi:3-mercaptopyruvate sulfurtransferase SseA